MKLVLIRHAQSARNAVFHGNTFYKDNQEKLGTPNHFIHLTDKGRGQAVEVGSTLYRNEAEHGTPKVILHSGFKRAKETAEIIKHEFETQHRSKNLPIEQNHLLRERDAGHAFEMRESEAAKHFPFLQDYWKFEGKWFAVPPGGESFVQVMDRVSLFLHALTSNRKYEGKTIYAVTHGGTMQAFKMVIEKVPFDEADKRVVNPKNCEVVRYEYENGEWKTFITE